MDSSCCQTKTDQHAVRFSAFDTRTCCEKTIAVPPLKFESIELNSTVNTVQKLKIQFGLSALSEIFTNASCIISPDASSGGVHVLPRESYVLTLPLRI